MNKRRGVAFTSFLPAVSPREAERNEPPRGVVDGLRRHTDMTLSGLKRK